MQYGYFLNASQEVPEYDPGLNVNCPICEALLSSPMKTISVLLVGDDRSFFYRTHKACYENLTEDEQTKLDSLVVDVRYMQKALQTFKPANNACSGLAGMGRLIV